MAGNSHVLTEEDVIELTLCLNDPIYFIDTYTKIEHPSFGVQDFSLYQYQMDAVDKYHNNKNCIQVSSRQMGMDTLAAAYLLWYVTFKTDRTVLSLSPKQRDAYDFLERVRFMHEHLPPFLKVGLRKNNKGEMAFDNGSVILARNATPSSGRGFAVSLLHLRDFSWVEPNVQEELFEGMIPCISPTGGQVIMTTSAYRPDANPDNPSLFNRLYRDAEKESSQWTPIKIHYRERPGITRQWVEETKARMGQDAFDAEYELKGY